LIRGERIVDVYAAGSRPPPAGARLIDLGGATLLPGLIDCHTHVFLQGEGPAAGGYDAQPLQFPPSYPPGRAPLPPPRPARPRDARSSRASPPSATSRPRVPATATSASSRRSTRATSPDRACSS